MEGVQRFDDAMNNWFSPLRTNENVATITLLILIIYASWAAPRLSEGFVRLFDHWLVKLVVLLLIAYSAKQNPAVGVVAAVAFLVTLQILNKMKAERMMMSYIQDNESSAAPVIINNTVPERQQPPRPANMVLEEAQFPTKYVNGESLAQLNEDEKDEENGCVKKANFRNNFYPQYVNLKPDAYMARYTGADVPGFDEYANYVKHSQ
jgi:hypothetical protein